MMQGEETCYNSKQLFLDLYCASFLILEDFCFAVTHRSKGSQTTVFQ